jgi:hypothetical protein|tara:strand:+ start:264 stop:575 length:312 start_codon:yes stop_codon:yes gene_type:complete
MTDPMEYAEAYEITGKTAKEFEAWIHSFKEDSITVITPRRIKTIYTDGDEGIIILRSHCDMFEDEGMEVSVIGSYCEIPYYLMQNMLFDIENAVEQSNISEVA